MKVLILNSGLGSRMGVLTKEHPKCMTNITVEDTIISRQLKQLLNVGIKDVVITTGLFDEVLQNYCMKLDLPLNITFVKNPVYRDTNYIYSIYCAKDFLNDDIVLMHGDLVFDTDILKKLLLNLSSCMAISSTVALPEKDFKAVIDDKKISKIGIEFFQNAVTAQPIYKLNKKDWLVWLQSIKSFCENGITKCYAENAFNVVSDQCNIYPFDVKNELCTEIDNKDDLKKVINILKSGDVKKYGRKK